MNAKANFPLCPEIGDLKTERQIEQFIKLFLNAYKTSDYYHAFPMCEEYYEKVAEFLVLECLGSGGKQEGQSPVF